MARCWTRSRADRARRTGTIYKLELAFEIAAQGTIAEGALLDLEEVPVRCYCPHCDLEFTPDDLIIACPQCHDAGVAVRQGYGCELGSIEIS